MKKKAWWLVGVMLAAVIAVGVLSISKGYFILAPAVRLQLNGESALEVAAHSSYDDAGCSAWRGGQDLSAQLVTESAVDTTIPGTYTITYRLTYKNKEYVQQRTVTVVDRTAPELTLLGEQGMKIPAAHLYEEPGFAAYDLCDGDLTESVQTTQTLDGETMTIVYTVSDHAGNEASMQRVVTVRDDTAPVIYLKGESTVYVPLGGSYREAGYAASDDADGDLTSAVVRSGSVDASALGTYTLRYSVRDKAGNYAEVTRSVKVYTYTPNPADRVCLTFDDGPSTTVTPRILDILAANQVKATFFICDYNQDTKPLVARMINEGHTVAIHGYSHDYATIYANDEAFMNNVYRLRDKLLADFGYQATLLRFPGGSSNTVSRSYNKGIMSRLVKRVTNEGFVYFDWNVSSGDANTPPLSKAQIYRNVTSCLVRGRVNVVLMHDSGAKTTTADALQDIIDYCKTRNFTLLPMTPATPLVRHSVAN